MIYKEVTDIRCFDECTEFSRIYIAVSYIRCGRLFCVHVYHVCSRIYGMFMDIC